MPNYNDYHPPPPLDQAVIAILGRPTAREEKEAGGGEGLGKWLIHVVQKMKNLKRHIKKHGVCLGALF